MEQTKQINGVHILGNADSYQLFGLNGQMERNVRVHLDRGVRVIYHGYGMSTTEMVVYDDKMNAVAIYAGDNPEVVSEHEAADVSWVPTFSRIDDCCRPLSRVFGIGHYYDESGKMVSDDVIEKSIAHAKAVDAARAKAKRKEKEAWDNAVAKAKSEYAGILTPLEGIKDYGEREKTQKRNLMTLLKREFPGVKFTGRKGYSQMTLTWTDGPSVDEVEAVAQKFEDEFDGDSYSDYSSTKSTPFTSVFGGWDSVKTERKYTDAFTERCKAEAEKFTTEAEFRWHVQEVFKSHLTEYAGENREYWWRVIAEHTSDYRKPVKPQKAKAPADDAPQTYKIVNYSEKAIAVTGDTRSVRDKLKELGGRFNSRLSCGAGWIFSKKKEADVRMALGI